MSKKRLTLADLKKQGLVLSKTDAQELHHHISRISQHGSDADVVFDGEEPEEKEEAGKPAKAKGKKVPEPENNGDLDNSTEDKEDNDDSSKLTESQEDELLAFLGLTKENSPEEYCAALSDYISTNESHDPKLLNKLQELSDHFCSNVSDPSPGIKIQRPTPGEHHATKKKRLKDAGLMEHIVNQEDLDNNPELSETGVKPGDVIEIPIAE